MVNCPECGSSLDLEEDDVAEGETVTCPDCEAVLEVVSTNPLEFTVIETADDEEELDKDEDEDEDDDEDEYEEEDEDESSDFY